MDLESHNTNRISEVVTEPGILQREDNVGSEWVILFGMTSRVGPKGQVVIPKPLRDQIGIVPGDEVEITYVDQGVRIDVVRETRPLRGRFAGRGLLDELSRDHQQEMSR